MSAERIKDFTAGHEDVDLQVELAALRARLEALTALVSARAAERPALLGRGWVMSVANVVAQEYALTLDELVGPCRTMKVVKPRQLWVWLVRTSGGFSFPETARLTGYLEHTTVLHCCKRVEGFRARDEYFRIISDALLDIAKITREEAFSAAKVRAGKLAEGHAAGLLNGPGPEGLL